ncbi:hypothetical protein ACQ4PT_070583 [Festuca glaucescens]
MGNGKVYATIVLIRLIYAGMHILTKAAFEEGMSTTVFVFYRHAVAAIFLAPFAFFLEIRKRPTPPLTVRLSFKIFVHAFYGMAGTINLYSIGLNYASATSSSAIFNIVPVVAFILAVMFRSGIQTRIMDGDSEAEDCPWHGQSLGDSSLRRRGGGAGAVPRPPAQVLQPSPSPAQHQHGRARASGEELGAGDLPHDRIGRDMVSLDSEAGPPVAGVPIQASEHHAPVHLRKRPVVRHRHHHGEGPGAVEARWRHEPRRGALHGYCCRGDLVLPADLGDREERPGVPVHVDAAEPRLHHGDRLVPIGGRRQPRKHYRWRAARRRSLCRALGQGQGGSSGGQSTAAAGGNQGERDVRRDRKGLMRSWARSIMDLEILLYEWCDRRYHAMMVIGQRMEAG